MAIEELLHDERGAERKQKEKEEQEMQLQLHTVS